MDVATVRPTGNEWTAMGWTRNCPLSISLRYGWNLSSITQDVSELFLLAEVQQVKKKKKKKECYIRERQSSSWRPETEWAVAHGGRGFNIPSPINIVMQQRVEQVPDFPNKVGVLYDVNGRRLVAATLNISDPHILRNAIEGYAGRQIPHPALPKNPFAVR
jgi:hypothetical protein